MRWRREEGSTLIDALLLGLLFIGPLVWLLGMLADVHSAALATTAAVREAGIDASRSGDRRAAQQAIEAAVANAFVDQALDPSLARIHTSGATDWARGEEFELLVEYPVTVLQAPLLGRVAGPSLIVRARHVARIDPFRSRDE